MEPQWNPALEDQAMDRVYRIGQRKEVTTVRYIVANTLEEVGCLLPQTGINIVSVPDSSPSPFPRLYDSNHPQLFSCVHEIS